MNIIKTINTFKKLAASCHFQSRQNDIIAEQNNDLKQAITSNDSQAVKALFCQPGYLANKTTIFND